MRSRWRSQASSGLSSRARRAVRWLGLGAVVVGGLGLGRMAHAASPEGAGEGRPYYCERVASSPDDWAVYPECAARETSPSKAEKTRPLVCMGLEATRDVWLAYPECRGVVKAPAPLAERSSAPAYCRGLTSSGDLVAYPECASAASFETSSGVPRRGAPSFCDGVAPGPENDLAYPECVR